MASEHLRDPLDYLYEELPPERMAEARKHLSECQECRAAMRAVRETVKQYREAGKPTPPAGLAARAARAALAEAGKMKNAPVPARTESQPASLAAPAPALPPDIEKEFARLKEEVMREVPRGWRATLYHPGWAVAASVLFVFSLLIHFSPRMNRLPAHYIPAAVAREGTPAQTRDRERLPAVIDLPEQAVPIVETTQLVQKAPELDDATGTERSQSGSGETTLYLKPGIGIRMRTSGTAAEPEQGEESVTARIATLREEALAPRPEAAPAMAAPVQPPAGDVFAASAASIPTMQATESDDDARERKTAAKEERPIPSQQQPQPAPPAPAALQASGPPSRTAPASTAEAETEEPARHLSGGVAPAPISELPAETEVQADTATDSLDAPQDKAPAVVIMDMPAPENVPQLIARPTPINVPERIQSLTTLAGMQMASGEFADAWQSVKLLEAYDAEAARNLAKVLSGLEEAARKDNANPAAPTDEPPAEAAEEPHMDKYGAFSEPETAPVPTEPAPSEPIAEAPPQPAPSYTQYLFNMAEPPEDPPLSTVIVPAPPVQPEPEPARQVVLLEPFSVDFIVSVPEPYFTTDQQPEPQGSESALVSSPIPPEELEEFLTEPEPAAAHTASETVAPEEPAAQVMHYQEPSVIILQQPHQAPAPQPKRRAFSSDPYIRGY